jgi:hypothetical protein
MAEQMIDKNKIMNIHKSYTIFLIVTFLTAILTAIKTPYYNYLPIIYGFILYLFYSIKCLNLTFKSSSYIQKTHPSFYEKHKTTTNSFEGKTVSLYKSEILKLNDKIALDYYIKIKRLIILMFLTFLSIFVLSLLIILV